MNGFYQFTTKIKDTLKLDPFVNTVTYGDIFQVDLSKQTIFPLSHLVVNNVTKESNVMRFNISILAMDIVDMTKDETTDTFIGNDNTQDIWHTQLKVLDRLTELLRRGNIVSEGYKLDGNPIFEQFTERFENYLAGWTVTFDVLVGNDMTICEVGSSGGTCSPAGYLIKDSAGTTLYNGTIASGEIGTITVEDSTYLVEYVNGTLIESGSILAEGSVTVQVPNPVTCEDATVNVNGAFWDSVPSGGTENVIVRQSSGSTQVGSIQGQYFRIADSTAVLKTTGGTTISTTSIKAEASENIVAPNTTIEVNGTTEGTVEAGATVDIQLSNPSGTVTPTSVTQVGNDLQVVLPASASPHWTRNPDWLPLDTVTVGSQKFSGLFAVYETQKNVCTIQCETGTRTIDWGDGTTQVALTGTLYTKVYDYASLTSPIITDEFGYNYKTVVVNIPMTSCTQLYIDRNTTATLINNTRSLNWLDVALDCSTLIVFFPSNQGISNKMERLVIYNVGATISGNAYFVQMARLKVLKFPFDKLQASNQTFTNYFGNVRNEDGTPININLSINTGSLFNLFSLSSITRIGNFTAPLSSSGQSLFESSTQLISIGSVNLSSAANLVSMFLNCVNLENVVNITITSTCTSITQIGLNARKCKGFVIGNCSGITTATNAFFNMVSMETLILTGMTRGFVIDDCNMSATAIDALFTSLGTAVGSQTISVKRNPGSATCTTSIATSKGYTVLTA
jgi:hypothetical protein